MYARLRSILFALSVSVVTGSLAQHANPVDVWKGMKQPQSRQVIPSAQQITVSQAQTPATTSFHLSQPGGLSTTVKEEYSVFTLKDLSNEGEAYLRQHGVIDAQTGISVSTTSVSNGSFRIKAIQLLDGITIYGSEILIHGSGQQITSANGQINQNVSFLNDVVNLSRQDALDQVIEMQSAASVNTLSKEQDAMMHRQDQVELVWYPDPQTGVLHKTWHIVRMANLLERESFFINAHSGVLIARHNQTCAADGPKTANVSDFNSIIRTINTYQVGNNYYLIDGSKSMFLPGSVMPGKPEGAIWTLDAGNTFVQSMGQITNTDNLTWSSKAVSAHYHAALVYDYFKNTHNFNSLNNNGGNIVSVINVTNLNGTPLDNMFWNGSMVLYGNGNTNFRPLVGSLDMAAHEFTHGVIQASANLDYWGQSGAINESFADIFGCMLDRSDWLIGEDAVKSSAYPSGALRNLQDPHQGTTNGNNGWQPAHMNEYVITSTDNGGVHMNSGILNKAYATLCNNLPMTKAEKIYFRAMTTYVTRFAQFSDLRYAVIQSAADLYGGINSTEANAVRAAFDAVGIYDGGNGLNYALDIPAISGIEKILVYDPNFFNTFRLLNVKTDGTNATSVSRTPSRQKPSITDDGAFCVFVDTGGRVRKLSLTGLFEETILFPNEDFYAYAAISKDGSKLAVTTTAVDTSVFVYVFQTNNWYQYKINNPTFTNGQHSPGALYAGSLEWDYSGENLLIDARYTIGDSTTYWDLAMVNVWNNASNSPASGRVDKINTQLNTDISTFNPSFARNSPYIIVYETYNKRINQYGIYCKNLISGKVGFIFNPTMISTPTYSRNDDRILFSSYDMPLLDTSVLSIGLDQNKIESNMAPTVLAGHMKYANWYTQGQRVTIPSDKSLLRYNLSTLVPASKGIFIGDSVLLKVNENDNLNNLIADFVTSPFATADIGGTPQVSGFSANNYSNPVVVRITAKDLTSKNYTIITQKPSKSKEITAFSFQDVTPVSIGTFRNDSIFLTIPKNTDITDLVATFSVSAFAKVTVGGLVQKSGVTSNDYFSPVTYTVTAYDSSTRNYVVVVKLINDGLHEEVGLHASLFPNPADHLLHTGLNGKFDVDIQTIDGRKMIEEKDWNGPIDISILHPGLYFITLRQSGRSTTERFIRN